MSPNLAIADTLTLKILRDRTGLERTLDLDFFTEWQQTSDIELTGRSLTYPASHPTVLTFSLRNCNKRRPKAGAMPYPVN